MKGDKKDYVVDLEHQKCDCSLYAVEKIPYSHAIAAGTYAGLHISMPHLYARFTQRILFFITSTNLQYERIPYSSSQHDAKAKDRYESFLFSFILLYIHIGKKNISNFMEP